MTTVDMLVIFVRGTVIRNVYVLCKTLNRVVARGSNGLGLNVPKVVCVNNVSNLVKTFLCRGSGPSPGTLINMLVSFLYTFTYTTVNNLVCDVLAVALHMGRGMANLTLAVFNANFNGFFNNSVSGLTNNMKRVSMGMAKDTCATGVPKLSGVPIVKNVLFGCNFLACLYVVVTILLSFFLFGAETKLGLETVNRGPKATSTTNVGIVGCGCLSAYVNTNLTNLNKLCFMVRCSKKA